eukprot:21082-Rhodomonas_salina.2
MHSADPASAVEDPVHGSQFATEAWPASRFDVPGGHRLQTSAGSDMPYISMSQSLVRVTVSLYAPTPHGSHSHDLPKKPTSQWQSLA